jgi:hypothetical protein
MKRVYRVALFALVLMMVFVQVGQAVASDPIQGTWSGLYKSSAGSGSVSIRFYVTCLNGKARLRAIDRTRALGYEFKNGKLVVSGSLFGVSKTPEFNYSLNKKKTTLKLSGTWYGVPVGAVLTKASPSVSKVSVKKPKANKAKTVTIKTNSATEFVYLTKTDGTVVGYADERDNGAFRIVYSGWKKGYNNLYAYAGMCDVNGAKPVTKIVGEKLTSADTALLSKKVKLRVRAT